MRQLARRLLMAVFTFAIGISTTSVWPLSEYDRGRLEARRDIDNAKLVLRTYGMPVEGRDFYKEILQDQYEIELTAVAGCEVTEDLIERVRGYNEVTISAIERKYGEGILERARLEAEEQWKRMPKPGLEKE